MLGARVCLHKRLVDDHLAVMPVSSPAATYLHRPRIGSKIAFVDADRNAVNEKASSVWRVPEEIPLKAEWPRLLQVSSPHRVPECAVL
jgi:hypothetical protein